MADPASRYEIAMIGIVGCVGDHTVRMYSCRGGRENFVT